MTSRRESRRGRTRGQTLHAAVNHCCYRDRDLGPQVFLCSQFHEKENGTVSSAVVGGAHCCRPSRDWAFCCNKAEFDKGVQEGNDPDPHCGRFHTGRRFHRRFMVPRVAVTVGSILVLLIIGIAIYFCFKKRFLNKKRENRVMHGWVVPNGMPRQDSAMVVGVPGVHGDLITPYHQATAPQDLRSYRAVTGSCHQLQSPVQTGPTVAGRGGPRPYMSRVYTLPASNHPVQYMGGSQCPLREYGPLQPAYPGRQFVGPPPTGARLPGVSEVR